MFDRGDLFIMALFSKLKERSEAKKKKIKEEDLSSGRVSVYTMEAKFESEDLVGAARDLKSLLEIYGIRKKKNHRYKGREFIHFILSSKHKDLKSTGYKHWQNINQIIILNHKTVYPFHKQNLRDAMTFFEKEIKGLNTIDVFLE